MLFNQVNQIVNPVIMNTMLWTREKVEITSEIQNIPRINACATIDGS
jgi:hypothetical protein